MFQMDSFYFRRLFSAAQSDMRLKVFSLERKCRVEQEKTRLWMNYSINQSIFDR